ncbi:MAG: hypothetical protein IJ757_03705 [Clostridiales bacterium]|nr:hypothetical protein [Clostridiales bacterium]
MTDYYETNIPVLKAKSEELNKKNRRLSSLRLVFFALFAASLIAAFVRSMSVPLFVVSGLSIAVFIVLCVIHGRSKYEALIVEEKKLSNGRYIARMKGDFSKFPDTGEEFINHSHPFASDLDIFGQHSVFELYNISHSIFGRQAFANRLKCKHFDRITAESVREDQRLVEALSSDPDFLLEYEAVGSVHPIKKVPEAMLRLCAKEKKLSRSVKLFYKLAPFLWLLPVVTLLLGYTSYAKAAVLVVILLNLLIWFFVSRPNCEDILKAGLISKQAKAIKVRSDLIFDKAPGKELIIPKIIDDSVKTDVDELIRSCRLCSFREQPILALIFNVILPFDLICADRLIDWSVEHGSRFMDSVDSIGQLESMMSACVPGIISRISCFPSIAEDKNAFFDGTDMVHPLLDPSKAVPNSVSIDSKTALITGSNMSGKTTLIRTVGIMCVLTYIGAKVPATSVNTSIMRIMSSMRIADSLEENMSTFKAELIRIGSIVSASSEETPLLFLVDEVFRGTNSQDRTDGATMLLNKLNKPYIAGFMTTHDYALCDRVAEGKLQGIVFYHFSERYEGEEIIFDYKLKDGMSHESNAKFLMKLVGII